jgi:predicted ATPase
VVFQPDQGKGIDLDMPIVSSMVKELSMFVLYLLYEAKPNDLLVIDEPEMHLHPEAQAKFTEFLAMLINAGLNIIITTHSPYLVDHLINLVKAAEHNDLETLKEKFFLKRSDAFISKNKVSAYLFEKNTAKNIMDETGFIDWETFGEVSDRIMQLRLEL